MTEPTLETWMSRLAAALGVSTEGVDIRTVLDVARDAAHNVDRPAAPLTTFLAGYAAGLRGGDADQIAAALRTATELAIGEGENPTQ